MFENLVDRFLRYVKIDTQSSEEVTDRYPSTEKQKDLLRLLKKELEELGLSDVTMDEYGYVTATLKSNLNKPDVKKIGFIAHVDTSPETSGKDVNPILHENYDGKDIVLKDGVVIRVEENKDLLNWIGETIITSDGTTLLGADDKAGIAIIMTMLEYFVKNPDVPRCEIKVAFTPDEEVGRGTEYFDIEKFGADFAYTVDGGAAGEVENETFNAYHAILKVKGYNVHPGYAKNKLVNAIRVVGEFIHELNKYPSPETTENKEGYLHPYVMKGEVDSASLKLILRDFDSEEMKKKVELIKEIKEKVQSKFPKAEIELEVKEQYKNMKQYLDAKPEVVELLIEAVKRTGLTPKLQSIRGGTDGSRLSSLGLLTPNIFTGAHNMHSKKEWVSVGAMKKSVETLINLVKLWAEK